MLILLVLGLVCFILAAAGVAVSRVNLVATGLACWIATVLIGAWPGRVIPGRQIATISRRTPWASTRKRSWPLSRPG